MADQRYLSKQEAARRFDVSEKTIDRLRSSGKLDWIPVGSRVRIPIASLEAYEQRQREQRRPPKREDDFEALFPLGEPDEIRTRRAVERALPLATILGSGAAA